MAMVVEKSDRGLFKARLLHLLWDIEKKLGKPDSGHLNSRVSIYKQKTRCDVQFIFQIAKISASYVPSTGRIETCMTFGENLRETFTKKS